jgi:hypothetical protein
MGLAVALAGAFFTWVLWRSYQLTMETLDWKQAACVIVDAYAEEYKPELNRPPEYHVQIKYSYQVGMENFISYRVKRQDNNVRTKEGEELPKITRKVKDMKIAQELLNKYKRGETKICFYNPADPTQAVLEHGSKGGLYSIWFPLLFVVLGGGIFINMILPHPSDKEGSVVKRAVEIKVTKGGRQFTTETQRIDQQKHTPAASNCASETEEEEDWSNGSSTTMDQDTASDGE